MAAVTHTLEMGNDVCDCTQTQTQEGRRKRKNHGSKKKKMSWILGRMLSVEKDAMFVLCVEIYVYNNRASCIPRAV